MQKTLKTLLFITSLSFFSFSLFSVSATELKGKETKIVGGTKAAFGAWPSTVALLHVAVIKKVEAGTMRYPTGGIVPKDHANYQAQFCGATLIDSKWVLTAAHCLVENGVTEKAEDINVLLGATDLIDDGTREKVKRIIVHSDYNKSTGDNDIALLELESKTNVSTIKVAERDVPAGTLGTVVGWGALNKDATGLPSELYEVELPLVDRQVCESLYGTTEFTNNMLCAGYTQGGKDTCQGDSGGPLMARVNGYYQQIGITSWGVSCAEPGQFGAYTRLSQFKNWISSQTKDSSNNSGGGSLFFLLIPLFLLTLTRRKFIK